MRSETTAEARPSTHPDAVDVVAEGKARVAEPRRAAKARRALVEPQFADPDRQLPLEVVSIAPPPVELRVKREARRAGPDERKTRYSLPERLDSPSPIGYRTRLPLSRESAAQALALLTLDRPTGFVPTGEPISEQELFEESALGVLSSRQSTNFRGQRQVTFGPEDSRTIAGLLRQLGPRDAAVLDHAAYTHVVLTRPYRTLFTHFLTFVGHRPLLSLAGVPLRALRKLVTKVADIPTIDYLQLLHLGILADTMERAAVLASAAHRQAQIHLAPFVGPEDRGRRSAAYKRLEQLCGLSWRDRQAGWRIGLVAQVGAVPEKDRPPLSAALCRRVAANLLAFRSERIQPGVNADDKAPPAYQRRQAMDVPDELTVQAGRAAFNAFAHWTGLEREQAKRLLLLERVDVLTDNGKERLRALREELERVFEQIKRSLPLWAELPPARLLSRQMAASKKAFALAGQRVYIGGLSRREVDRAGLDWELALCAFGASAARGTLYCELMGVVELPEDCDLLAGTCMMAGPVNQNDVGKTFFGNPDLLAETYGDRDPTALLVWTLKAKTIADPIGNEEQLLSTEHRGPLVGLRPGPHEVVALRRRGALTPLRLRGKQVNAERAFSDQENFVTSPEGDHIPGNRGKPWPRAAARAKLWR